MDLPFRPELRFRLVDFDHLAIVIHFGVQQMESVHLQCFTETNTTHSVLWRATSL